VGAHRVQCWNDRRVFPLNRGYCGGGPGEDPFEGGYGTVD